MIFGLNPNQIALRLFDSLFAELADELEEAAEPLGCECKLSEAQVDAIRASLGAAWIAPMWKTHAGASRSAHGSVALRELARRRGVGLRHDKARKATARKAGTGTEGEKLFRAIVGQESGGKNIRNRDSGATGIGQVMPANIARWSKEILGRSLTKAEFEARPDLQAKIVRGKLAQYYQEGLRVTKSESEAVRYAAAKWYSGSGHYRNNTKPQFSNGRRYPSIASYANKILARYRRQ